MKWEAVACCIGNLRDRDFQDPCSFVGVAQRLFQSRPG